MTSKKRIRGKKAQGISPGQYHIIKRRINVSVHEPNRYTARLILVTLKNSTLHQRHS
nr:MAG TPA: hypothetical protein [Caudoviricetes sp.]